MINKGSLSAQKPEEKSTAVAVEGLPLVFSEHFRLFLDNAPTIAWIKDEDGKHVFLSQTYEKRFGVRLADWLGKTDFELWPTEVAERFRQNDLAVLAAGKPIEFEEVTYDPDGHACYWLNTKFPFRDAVGRSYIAGIGLDITKIKNYENLLKHQAQIDSLTHVSSRGHFIDQAETELKRAVRYGSPLSVMMLDIDFFKRVNDTHGHRAGDAVLVKLAEVILQTLRDVDIIGRLGGEEFAILLPETNTEQAFKVAERLGVEVSKTKVPIKNGLPLNFTVSIGVASMMSNDDNIDTLLNLADIALYKAKNSGRNKVCF